MRSENFEVIYTKEENFKFNAIKCKDEERCKIMALYRLMLMLVEKQDAERIYFDYTKSLNKLEISLDELMQHIKKRLKKYKFTKYALYKKIKQMEEVRLIKIEKGRKKNIYSFCHFWGKDDVLERIKDKREEQKSIDNQDIANNPIINEESSENDCLNTEKSIENDIIVNNNLFYFTSSVEAEKLAEKILEEFKPKKTNNNFLAAKSRVLEKVRKYYSKIAVGGAGAYIRTIITESLIVCRKTSNKIKNKINSTKNKKGNFNNFTEREYTKQDYQEILDASAYDWSMQN